MNPHVKHVLHECAQGSHAGRLTFPQVVAALRNAGIERYRADLVLGQTSYYQPDGAAHVVTTAPPTTPAASTFSAAGVEAAIRASQAQSITYREFCALALAAGCVDYLVSLAGRRAVYCGRSGESYVELFPATL